MHTTEGDTSVMANYLVVMLGRAGAMNWFTILALDSIESWEEPKKVVDRISSAVLRGVSHEGRLIGREACNQEQEGNRDT